MLTLAIVVALASSSVLTLHVQKASAQEASTTIYLTPAVNIAQSGEYFNVSVMVANVINLWTYQIYVSYSPDMLEIPRNTSTIDPNSKYAYYVYQGNFLNRGAYSTFWIPKVNNTIGLLQAWEAILAPGPESSGSGELFSMTLKVKNPGMCGLHVCNDSMITRYQVPISHDVREGIFTSLASVTTEEIQWQNSTFLVQIESNSTVSPVEFSQPSKSLCFSVNGTDGTTGFGTVIIPMTLLSAQGGNWTVLMDCNQVTPLTGGNSTHSFIYVNYTHSTHQVRIFGTEAVSEFTLFIALSFVIFAMGILAVSSRKKNSKQVGEKLQV